MFTFKILAPEIVAAVKAGNGELVRAIEKSNTLQEREVAALEALNELLRRQCRPARPRGLAFLLLEETMDNLTYKISAEAAVDPDVEVRKLTVTVDGVARPEQLFGPDATDLGTITVPQDSKVKLSLVDVDDSKNESPALVKEFDATDTLPPPTPGGLGVLLVGEAEAITPEDVGELPPAVVEPTPETPAEPTPETPAE